MTDSPTQQKAMQKLTCFFNCQSNSILTFSATFLTATVHLGQECTQPADWAIKVVTILHPSVGILACLHMCKAAEPDQFH